MKITKSFLLALFVVVLSSVVMNGNFVNLTTSIQAKNTQNDSLTIYTYKSLMNNPYYDIIGNFSSYSGISRDKINITRFSSPYELMNTIIKEKNNPKADIVIGIDNALTNLFNASDMFAPYENTSVLQNLDQNFIINLGPNNHLVPFDYAPIGLYYNTTRVNNTSYSFFNNFTLDDLINSSLASKIIIENPKSSTLGLGFLLWTIADYGDPSAGFFLKGFLAKYWQPFWKKIGKDFTITKNYNEAYNLFSDPSADKLMMVSYTTQQAYDYCTHGTTSSSSLITTFMNETRLNSSAWFQIEGLGIVKKSPNQALAKEFVDWFLSTKIQNQIPQTQWKYPVNKKATTPACFTQSGAPNPDEVLQLNRYLNPTTMNYFLSTWIGQWDNIIYPKGLPGFELQSIIIVIPIFVVLSILRKKSFFK